MSWAASKAVGQVSRRRGKERNFLGEHFRARGYAVSTVGFELEKRTDRGHRVLGGIAMHICTFSSIKCPSRNLAFLLLRQAMEGPGDNGSARKLLSAVVWARNTPWYLQSHLEWDRLWIKR